MYRMSAIGTMREPPPADWEHKNLAMSVQEHLEDVVVRYVQHHWLQRSRKRRLCLSAGVFANVLVNQRVAELAECGGVFVVPPMRDAGLASGAAL
ncbi:MAG: hypothetical protein A2Z18_02380 [Armatimonadetes bacterium RBG_16_58_9]|nr:MAG: hypothetical protein A2Z18_02380 [Armatimonadetes bacterium RBG_16_58_9]